MIPYSNEIRIEVSTICHYNCVICPRKSLTRPKGIMSDVLFNFLLIEIKNQTVQYDTLTFPGMGEPLLDNTLLHKIELARIKGFEVLLLSNGSLLTVDIFKKLEELGVASVRVSLYGTDAKSYAQAHGVGWDMYKRVRDNLLEISAIRTKTKLLLTYNEMNGIGNYQEWINQWKDKVDLLEVWRPHNWVEGKQYRAIQEKKLKTCGRPFNGPLQIQIDGTVNMCCFDFNGKLTLGDLKTQSLEEIFKSSIYKKIAECHTSGQFKGSRLICEHCDQRNADKSNILICSSRNSTGKRVNQVSTTYKDVL